MEDVLITIGMEVGSACIESMVVQVGCTVLIVLCHQIAIIVHIIVDKELVGK